MAEFDDETLLSSFAQIPASQIRRSFRYNHRLLPNEYLAEQEAISSNLADAVHHTGLSMGYPAWNLLYYTLLTSLRSEEPIVIETGTNMGFSTIIMAQVLKDVQARSVVRTIELNSEIAKLAEEHARAAGVQKFIGFSVGDSLDFLKQLTKEVSKIHFAFLDGSHDCAHVIKEFELIRSHIVAGEGTVFFDNTEAGGVMEALHYIRSTHGGNLIRFTNCSWAPPGNAIWQP